MIFSGLNLIIAVTILALGMVVLWYLKWTRPITARIGAETEHTSSSEPDQTRDTFDTFFLGGGRVGETLTANNNWSLCFAFANALWYYCFLGYYYGPSMFLLQLPWSLAVVSIALLLGRYIAASRYGTVHGFIDHQFGRKAAMLAAVATVIGYTLNVGFELFYSAYLISKSIGIGELSLVLAIFLAIFVAGYCLAGGYSANVRTDRYQNAFGLLSSIVLIALITPAFKSVTGSSFFWKTQATFDPVPWHFVVGIAVFSFFFNFVDMANWQSIAANEKLSPDKLKRVSRGFVVSALIQVLAPALCGVWLGVMLKTLNAGIADDEYFAKALTYALPWQGPFTGIVLGLILLGFLYITISSAGSYILAGTQTLAVDLFWRTELNHGGMRVGNDQSQTDKLTEHRVLQWVKRWITLFSLSTVLIFAALYYGLGVAGIQAVVFQFQFAMYGAAVTLAPAIFFGMNALRRNRKPTLTPQGAFLSILIGLLCVLCPFGIAISPIGTAVTDAVGSLTAINLTPEAIVNLSPLLGLLAATLTALLFRNRRS